MLETLKNHIHCLQYVSEMISFIFFLMFSVPLAWKDFLKYSIK